MNHANTPELLDVQPHIEANPEDVARLVDLLLRCPRDQWISNASICRQLNIATRQVSALAAASQGLVVSTTSGYKHEAYVTGDDLDYAATLFLKRARADALRAMEYLRLKYRTGRGAHADESPELQALKVEVSGLIQSDLFSTTVPTPPTNPAASNAVGVPVNPLLKWHHH